MKILPYSVVNINLKRVNPATHLVILYAKNYLSYVLGTAMAVYVIGVQNCQYVTFLLDIDD